MSAFDKWWDERSAHPVDTYKDLTREAWDAALATIPREPTPAMQEAGWVAYIKSANAGAAPYDAWRAMYDAALK